MSGGNTERRSVVFVGSRSATAPLTWGQQTTWDDIQFFLPAVKYFFFLRRRVTVPIGLSLDDVLDGIRELVARHEVLRTLFRADEQGEVTQNVLDTGTFGVTVFCAVSSAECDFDALADEHERLAAASSLDHSVELPLRPVVGLLDGEPRTVILCVSHAAADMQGTHLLSDELSRVLQAMADGLPIPPRVTTWQPVDEAYFEQSPDGQRINGAALAYYQRQLDLSVPTMFGPPTGGERPRFWTGELRSRCIPLALRAIASRNRVGTSAILLATTAALLRGLTRVDRCALSLVCGNRSAPEVRNMVGTLSQTVLATIDTDVPSLDELVRQTASSAMRAYRHSRFDSRAAADLVRRTEAKQGVDFDLSCRFNDIWSSVTAPPTPDDPVDPAEIAAASRHTTFAWREATDLDKITFFLDFLGDRETIRLVLLADTCRMPPHMIQAFLTGFERVLVEFTSRDLGLDGIADIAGVVPLSESI